MTVPGRVRVEDLPKRLRDRVRDQLEPVAATNPARGSKPAAATNAQFACCRCGQTHPSLAAIERHCHAANHPRYRQLGVP